jgi:YD repeat-containing protein
MNALKAISLKTTLRVVFSLAAVALLSGFSMRVDAATTSDSYATTSYTYDSLNRLIRVTYADGSVIRYTYDAAGNRLIQTNH